MADLTPAQFAQDLNRKLQSLTNENKPFAIGVFDTQAKASIRIFQEGKNESDAKIGDYDTTKPLYVNPKDSPRSFQTKGKAGNTSKKNGQPYKTSYFSSYKSFRQAINAESSFVNLDLNGTLRSGYTNGLAKENANDYKTILRGENAGKALGLEKKYGAIFGLTQKEIDNLINITQLETIRELNA